VIGPSRRRREDRERVRYVSVDLLDAKDVQAKLSGLRDVTHVLYAAFQASSGAAADYATDIAANRDMLVHSVSTVDRASPRLERVVLVTGTKYYGSHLGPLKTPAREDDPRHLPPDFYFDQIDWLTDYQLRLGRDVERHEGAALRLPRRGRQRGDVRAAAAAVPRRADRALDGR
jgi:hypothetical protein